MQEKGNNLNSSAFTLVELLVVISIIALLMGILIPVLSAAKSQGKSVVCQNNIRQLVLANTGYANENDGFYVPAASDMYKSDGGLHRWHGVRKTEDDPFDPLKSPLVAYISDGEVKECPQDVKFLKGQDWSQNFEQGCGGYGYNQTYIGSRLWKGWKNENYEKTANLTEVTKPAETLMFADCAMAQKNDKGIAYLHEYSFAEPPFNSWGRSWPSIHFRHDDKANIGWCDGHISSEEMINFSIKSYDGIQSKSMNLGWFSTIDDNRLFDLK